MSFNTTTPESISKSIASGNWKPNMYLTNLSTAYYQSERDYVAGKFFPNVPVRLSSGKYYKFDKASLARDNVHRKPAYGKVQPFVFGSDEADYSCVVDQIIVGIDQIGTLNYQRSGAPGSADPRTAKARVIAEQIKIHQDILFAKNFFKSGIWENEYTGTSSTPTGKGFYQFDNDNSDPVQLFDDLILEIRREGRRKPNKLGLGTETYKALKHNKAIFEHVKFGGSTANPSTVNEKVLAELFGVEEVAVLASTYNAAELGKEADMKFICDPKGALLLFATSSPAVDEPSAGYTFTWDVLGNGQPLAMSQWLGENGTHSEFIEGIMAYDMKKTGDDLAVYLKDCVGTGII